MRLAIAALMVGLALPGLAAAEEIGAVDTVFKLGRITRSSSRRSMTPWSMA